jgi:hypothetical protein
VHRRRRRWRTLIRQTRRRLRFVPVAVTVAATLASLVVYLDLVFSEPNIKHGDLDAAEPLSIPFTIDNPHYFPLYVTERRCIVTMSYADHIEANQQWLYPSGTKPVPLPHLDVLPYDCPFRVLPDVAELRVRMLVRYKVGGILPEQTTRQHFRVMRDSQGAMHWSDGLDPAKSAPDFVEYPTPTEHGIISAFYCDRIGSPPPPDGCGSICGVNAPITGTGNAQVVQDGDTLHFRALLGPVVDLKAGP